MSLLATVLLGAGVLFQASPLTVVDNLDPARYRGRWYEIARLPNRFQDKCVGDVIAEYQPRAEGGFVVVNRCRTASGEISDASGIARPVSGAPSSVLQVRFAPAILSFLPMVWGDYQVLALDDEHSYSLVGTPDRKYLWILSRTPQLETGQYDRLVERARNQGFDVTKLTRTSQSGQ
jgi:apolipoprotein D and lipocalin family protein